MSIEQQHAHISVVIVNPKAKVPTKANDNAIGYDLTIIEECVNPPKHECKNLRFYDTGIQIKPPHGYYLEIHARSSLMKTGYMLANAVGIIDPDYRGNILVALTKFDHDMPDLVLGDGIRVAQLILRNVEKACDCVIVDKLDDTVRGSGGFGSTDIKQGRLKNSVQHVVRPLSWAEAVANLKPNKQ